MENPKSKSKIDWKSKLLDLLIVIIGITIAFQLNEWSESRKTTNEELDYLTSFYEENISNQNNLKEALNFSKNTKNDIDTLKNLLLTGNYKDNRINQLISKMMIMADFSPSITTMENIKASGEFDLIKNIDLRRDLISTYNSYTTTDKLEDMLKEYVNEYVTPFFMHNVRFSSLGISDPNIISDPKLENIVLGYEALLAQQIGGYERTLNKLTPLLDRLSKQKK
ncbi:DUF6090 family protein [Marinigracilibium pacificum]|uniref:Uncharacterized protein n=1 Tax=Marinigracilibium pacificum TaxID=2729599 RepID=A0A848J0M5_9BACT|nr:DUF6090 family protein [Marinigracilibium pacificum]NMM47829.1 hypothetical protein [Marinigracilibium pacificum]